MANGSTGAPLSAAGAALGLGDLLRDQTETEAERLRRLRQAQAMGRPDLATGVGGGIGMGPASILGGFGGRLR